ncbi:MAG: nuclease [Armatimonadetes bacterium]|nr:nuclease [Armatimonadota bacterium]
MSRTIVLDTGPLGLVTKHRGIPEAEACRQWIADCIHHGSSVLVPALAYYEVCRELERMNNRMGILRLDGFCGAVPGRYLPLSDTALRLGCRLWAQARNAGMTTADPKELDADVLIAAQALDLGLPASDLIIATTNVGHLSRFVTADLWTNIPP